MDFSVNRIAAAVTCNRAFPVTWYIPRWDHHILHKTIMIRRYKFFAVQEGSLKVSMNGSIHDECEWWSEQSVVKVYARHEISTIWQTDVTGSHSTSHSSVIFCHNLRGSLKFKCIKTSVVCFARAQEKVDELYFIRWSDGIPQNAIFQ